MKRSFTHLAATSALALSLSGSALADDHLESFEITGSDGVVLNAEPLEVFENPWAMTFLTDGYALVTEQGGTLWMLNTDGTKHSIVGNTPVVTMRGQGGLGDIVVHPDFAENGQIFISYVEYDPANDELNGAVVERAELGLVEDEYQLMDRTVIWRQAPKMRGYGHYSHRMAFAPDGSLFITSGDRQHFTPSQNMSMNLGKTIRIDTNGNALPDNPFYGEGGVADTIWSLGHRNLLGIDFDADGGLWTQEMGPRHGDELNRIYPAENYGYPVVSEGDHYDGTEISDHAEIPVYSAPVVSWAPAISPSGLIVYKDDLFADWTGDIFIGGLSSRARVRVEVNEEMTPRGTTRTSGEEAGRYEWEERVREVEAGPDGAIYILEDEEGGRLLRLTPAG